MFNVVTFFIVTLFAQLCASVGILLTNICMIASLHWEGRFGSIKLA